VEGRLALQEMERIVFSEKTDFELILSICQNNTFGPQALVVAKFDPNLREEETLVDPFIDMAIGCLNYAELSELEASYSNNSLVVMALKMAKLFITTRCMATTRMFAQTAHIASGRLVIFLVLIRCVRRLADMSWEFCLGTYQFLCHKVRVGYNPKIDKGLDPIWVATALYQRTACGLNDLRENPVIGKILGRMCNIHIICQVIKSILRDTYSRQKYLVKTKNCEALETEIPELSSSSSSFDIAFSQDASDIGKRIPLSPESYYAMATFISDGFPLSDSPLPSSSDAAGVLMDFCASQPAPMATTQDALGKPSVEHLDSTDAPHLPHGHNQILRVNTGSRSGSLETLKSTGSTETLPELPDTGPGDWTLDGLRMDFGPEIFGVLDSSSSSSFCSCCSFTCEHEPGTEGCCPYTDCSPGNCYCPQNGSPN
jgi:hypothetical protein